MKLQPDIERAVGDYLREHPAIEELGARVVPDPPRNRETPWVQVRQLDPSATTGNVHADHHLRYTMQLDCYAGDLPVEEQQAEASLLTRTVRVALHEMPGTHDDAVVTDVRFGSCPRIPDDEIEPPRQRYVMTCFVYARPA